jgi:Flp pilus assembly protein TadB
VADNDRRTLAQRATATGATLPIDMGPIRARLGLTDQDKCYIHEDLRLTIWHSDGRTTETTIAEAQHMADNDASHWKLAPYAVTPVLLLVAGMFLVSGVWSSILVALAVVAGWVFIAAGLAYAAGGSDRG